jgi:ubiquinone/menaquinone biosynthesis C-methylase UbiE
MDYDYDTHVQGVDSKFDVKLDKRTRRFLEAINNLKSPKVLEVGVGQGRYVKKLLNYRPDLKIYGVDISKTAIEGIKKSGPRGSYFVAGAEKLPFSANFFDVVVIADVLEHLSDPQSAVKEISRVVKKKGIFHFYVPCENQPFTLDWLFRKLNIARDFTFRHFGHIQYFSHQDIKKIISKYFKIKKISYSDHFLTQILHFLVLFLPKMILDSVRKGDLSITRDANDSSLKTIGLLGLFKKIWVTFISYPAMLLGEVETSIFKNVHFSAKGLHITAQKETITR